jgi:hypothetical protein
MTFEEAFKFAFNLSKYYQEKHYVWGFKSARNDKWYYTVTDYQPQFMMHLEHIT